MYDLLYFCLATLSIYFLLHHYRPLPNVSNKSNVSDINNNNNSNNIPQFKKFERRKSSLQGLGALGLPRRGSLPYRLPDEMRNAFFERFDSSSSSFNNLRQDLARVGALDKAGQIMVGVDFTASNEWMGKVSFGRTSLHKLRSSLSLNPYQKVILLLDKALGGLFPDNTILAYGFGDSKTKGDKVFSLARGEMTEKRCFDFRQVLLHYNNAVRSIKLGGPSNCEPVIKKTIDHVKESGNQYHLLLILTDGQLDKEESSTLQALAEASLYPISIVVVVVGDGHWKISEKGQQWLRENTKFENYKMVNFYEMCSKTDVNLEVDFALDALSEIAGQFSAMKDLGYL